MVLYLGFPLHSLQECSLLILQRTKGCGGTPFRDIVARLHVYTVVGHAAGAEDRFHELVHIQSQRFLLHGKGADNVSVAGTVCDALVGMIERHVPANEQVDPINGLRTGYSAAHPALLQQGCFHFLESHR